MLISFLVRDKSLAIASIKEPWLDWTSWISGRYNETCMSIITTAMVAYIMPKPTRLKRTKGIGSHALSGKQRFSTRVSRSVESPPPVSSYYYCYYYYFYYYYYYYYYI